MFPILMFNLKFNLKIPGILYWPRNDSLHLRNFLIVLCPTGLDIKFSHNLVTKFFGGWNSFNETFHLVQCFCFIPAMCYTYLYIKNLIVSYALWEVPFNQHIFKKIFESRNSLLVDIKLYHSSYISYKDALYTTLKN